MPRAAVVSVRPGGPYDRLRGHHGPAAGTRSRPGPAARVGGSRAVVPSGSGGGGDGPRGGSRGRLGSGDGPSGPGHRRRAHRAALGGLVQRRLRRPAGRRGRAPGKAGRPGRVGPGHGVGRGLRGAGAVRGPVHRVRCGGGCRASDRGRGGVGVQPEAQGDAAVLAAVRDRLRQPSVSGRPEPARWPWPAWWAVAGGALLGVAAHLGDVLPDIEADLRAGVRGLPQRLGAARTRLLLPLPLAGATAVLVLGPRGRPADPPSPSSAGWRSAPWW